MREHPQGAVAVGIGVAVESVENRRGLAEIDQIDRGPRLFVVHSEQLAARSRTTILIRIVRCLALSRGKR